jgi:hypothetical protein
MASYHKDTSPSPATSNRTYSFPVYGFPIIFFQRLSQIPVWHYGIVSSEVPGYLGVNSVTAISYPSLLQKLDEGIAPSLSQGCVVLEILTVVWATPTPLQTQWNFDLPYIHQLSRYFWTSARVSRATLYGFPCVSTLLPRESIYRFWQFLLG